MAMPEFIVVGSGCTGAMAAQTLVEAGKQVTMLDVGVRDQHYARLIPEKSFLDIRTTESDQYRYLIGDNLEGVSWGKVGKGEQITPPRKHIFKLVDTYLPVESSTFFPAESLGYGGLGIGWGIGCWEFSRPELQATGLNLNLMPSAYETVGQRIGISATRDEAAAYSLGQLKRFMPSPNLDRNHQLIYHNYQKHKEHLASRGMVLGRSPLALLTRNQGSRQAYAYRDMDYYSDAGQSAYRPWMTVNELGKKKNFSYQGNMLVLRFVETKDGVSLHCLETTTNKAAIFYCKTLVLAPGVLGSARIALRSLKKQAKLPLLCNPYSYIPCLQPIMVGKAAEPRKLGFAQLSFFLDEGRQHIDVAMASLYSYQSLMLFRIARQTPLNFADARIMLQFLMSGLTIMGIHQPDRPTNAKYVELVKDAAAPTGDKLKASYALSANEQAARTRREKTYMAAMRRLGSFPLRRIDPGFGSSIHYAGTLPFSDRETPYTLARNGRLHTTRRVFVADGSGFTYLPAKGLTFSLMANAHITAKNALGNE